MPAMQIWLLVVFHCYPSTGASAQPVGSAGCCGSGQGGMGRLPRQLFLSFLGCQSRLSTLLRPVSLPFRHACSQLGFLQALRLLVMMG